MDGRRGLLVRVGIDKTYGRYNAPINPDTNDYLYIPIPQNNNNFRPGMETTFDDLLPYFYSWSQRNATEIEFPQYLKNKACHLDPDFHFLTYGDQGTGRGWRIAELKEWDFLVFFASFNPIKKCDYNLIYALYGIMVVEKLLRVCEIPESEFHKNAHTRIKNMNNDHLVVFAKSLVSGRFNKAIPIGEFRNGSYRVKHTILDAWGDIDIKDGFIQRSINPPWFSKPMQFLSWLDSQQYKLINNNWQ